ncbi:MAG: S-layer homology domain-containing protein, partial [Clostridia bacterium]|nr:S-layer homology domain-containing protein [Clostridia bacterium]
MKKIIALLLCVVLLMGTLPVFAAQEDSEKMQEVLLIVKGKITVPETLSEFSSNVAEYDKVKSYRFEWSTPEFDEYLTISCDEKGRIQSYRTSSYTATDKKITDVSKAEIIAFAESFLRKIAPEAFKGETDLLVYNENDYYASGNLSYSVTFVRKKDGILVKDNQASVNLFVTEEGEIKIRNANINVDYDRDFAETGEDFAGYEAKYKELFPVEMIYRDEYNPEAKRNEPQRIPVLIYRIKEDTIGYMDCVTGEIVTEDPFDAASRNESASKDSVAMGAAPNASPLTPQELAELENIAGLISADEIRNVAKNLPYVDFPDELLLESSRLYKDNLGDYYYDLSYSLEKDSNYRHFSIHANAKTGKILRLSGNGAIPYKYTEEEIVLSDAQKQEASAKISEFLNAVAKDELLASEKKGDNAYRYNYSENYVRIVNGVKYINNGIQVTFDTENNIISSYSLNFTDGNFANPENAIGADTAYNKILEYAPIIPMYIRNDGAYKKVFTLEKRNIALDALDGEIKNKETKNNFTYSDISGHWAEEAATKLSEIQVGLQGGKLDPDRKITQEEFLRLAASAVWGNYYN